MTSTTSSSVTLCTQSGGEPNTKPDSLSSQGKDDETSLCSEADKDLGVPVLEGWPLGSTVFAYVEEAHHLWKCILMSYQTVSSFASCNSRYYHYIDLANHNCFRAGSLRPSKLDSGVLSTDVLWFPPHIHPFE
jgi:hypothetical protein